MLGKRRWWPRAGPWRLRLGGHLGRRRLVAADHGVAAQQLAGVALQAVAQAVGKEAHRGERGHGQHHGHGQQAQFAGAQVAQGLAPGQQRRRKGGGGQDAAAVIAGSSCRHGSASGRQGFECRLN
jgi:hypothetical protein